MRKIVGVCGLALVLAGCGSDSSSDSERDEFTYIIPGAEPAKTRQERFYDISIDTDSAWIIQHLDGCSNDGHYQLRAYDTLDYQIIADELRTIGHDFGDTDRYAAKVAGQGLEGDWQVVGEAGVLDVKITSTTMSKVSLTNTFCAGRHFINGEFVHSRDLDHKAYPKAKDCAQISIMALDSVTELGVIRIEYVDFANNFAHAMTFTGQGKTCRLERKANVYVTASEATCQEAYTQWNLREDKYEDESFWPEWWSFYPTFLQYEQDAANYFACIQDALPQ